MSGDASICHLSIYTVYICFNILATSLVFMCKVGVVGLCINNRNHTTPIYHSVTVLIFTLAHF